MDKQIMRGDDLHNTHLNQIGCILDATDKSSIKVMTSTGIQFWDLKDCTIVEKDDDFYPCENKF